MIYVIAILLGLLVFFAGGAAGHLLRIANALDAQNKHYGIGGTDNVVADLEKERAA